MKSRITKVILNTISITILLHFNLVMGKLAYGLNYIDSFVGVIYHKSIIFGLLCSLILVMVNSRIKNKYVYFLSIVLVLYTNFSMSRISENKSYNLFSFSDEYLNQFVLTIALIAGVFITLIRHLFNRKEEKEKEKEEKEKEDSNRIEFNYNPIHDTDETYWITFSVLNFIILMSNVAMEMAFFKMGITNAINLKVMLVGCMAIIVVILLKMIVAKNINR